MTIEDPRWQFPTLVAKLIDARVAGHLFNNREDIDRLVDVTSEFIRLHAGATA